MGKEVVLIKKMGEDLYLFKLKMYICRGCVYLSRTSYARNLSINRNQIRHQINMAKPIKETPVLIGKDAERFAYTMEYPWSVSRE